MYLLRPCLFLGTQYSSVTAQKIWYFMAQVKGKAPVSLPLVLMYRYAYVSCLYGVFPPSDLCRTWHLSHLNL